MRPNIDDTMIEIARSLSKRSTCSRRQVGCVLVDEYNHIIGAGYNGVGKGIEHCTDTPCLGALYRSGQGLDKCEAIHAEQNALLQCYNTMHIRTAYVTTSPCMHCAKLFLNTSVKRVVYNELYNPEVIAFLRQKGISVDYACGTV